MKESDQNKLLVENWDMLLKSLESLKMAAAKCTKIGQKEKYSFEEEESFDSMTARFARATDIYTQKVLRSVWALMRESYLPFIDFVNKAEKDGIIESAEEMLSIRELRNTIAHEYLPEALHELVFDVLKSHPMLLRNIESTASFIEHRNWLE